MRSRIPSGFSPDSPLDFHLNVSLGSTAPYMSNFDWVYLGNSLKVSSGHPPWLSSGNPFGVFFSGNHRRVPFWPSSSEVPSANISGVEQWLYIVRGWFNPVHKIFFCKSSRISFKESPRESLYKSYRSSFWEFSRNSFLNSFKESSRNLFLLSPMNFFGNLLGVPTLSLSEVSSRNPQGVPSENPSWPGEPGVYSKNPLWVSVRIPQKFLNQSLDKIPRRNSRRYATPNYRSFRKTFEISEAFVDESL